MSSRVSRLIDSNTLDYQTHGLHIDIEHVEWAARNLPPRVDPNRSERLEPVADCRCPCLHIRVMLIVVVLLRTDGSRIGGHRNHTVVRRDACRYRNEGMSGLWFESVVNREDSYRRHGRSG